MDNEEARTIGRRIKQVRYVREKSLRMIAGLAGMNRMTLQRIEQGQRPATLSEIVALANALEIAPSELTGLPVPAPANGHTDATTEAVRLALDAIDVGRPDGLVLPATVLREQVVQIHTQWRECRFADAATNLPVLIRNLHTTLNTSRDHGKLLDLAVYLHVHVTRQWLVYAGAPTDLVRRTVFLAHRSAQDRDEASVSAVAGFAVADVLLAGGALELGRTELDSITLPPITASVAGLVGLVTACHAMAAALDRRPGDATAPMDAATEVAERFGTTSEVDSLGFMFGPVNAGCFRMWLALEADEPDQVVSIAQGVDPDRHPFPVSRSIYWLHYGRALARLRGRQDEAVRSLRKAEEINPILVRRHPMAREAIAALVPGARRDAVGRELRAMAYRAGLPV